MATHSSVPAWRIPMDRGAGQGCRESDTTKRLSTAHVPAGSERTGKILAVCIMEIKGPKASL